MVLFQNWDIRRDLMRLLCRIVRCRIIPHAQSILHYDFNFRSVTISDQEIVATLPHLNYNLNKVLILNISSSNCFEIFVTITSTEIEFRFEDSFP